MTALVDICFITRKWAPAVGGMETYSLRLADHLARHRSLEVIALPGRDDGRPPSVPALLAFGLKTTIRLLLGRPAKIVHVADVASWPLAWIASRRHPGSRIILSAHGSDLSFAGRGGWRAALYGAYLRVGARCLPGASIVANSGWIAGLARDAGFRRVRIVALATDLRATAAPESHNGALLFAGRISRSKGLSFLVEHVLPLLPDPPRLRVAGTIWDAREARILASPLVDYLGSLSPAALAEEYQQAMCTLVPSLAPEGFGLAAIEAAACGGVVIASDHSGLAEAVLPDTGFLVDVADPGEWARRIEQIRGWSAEVRTAFVTRSMRVAASRYDWARVARETLAVYDEPRQVEERTAAAAV